MPILSNLIVRIGATTNDFDKAVDRSLNKIKRFASDVSSAGQALSIGFSLPLIAAGGAAIKAAADMQALTMGLQSVMKTSTATAVEMDKLRAVAKMPGIDLEGAVRGSIRLQILGRSADSSRKIMGELANSIAIAGGGADDFKVVSQQLVQMESLGKVTAENLNIIKERMPAMAKVMNDTWGPGAAADPAEFFKKLGLTSSQVIDTIIDKMSKGERAGNIFNNAWQNLGQAAKDAAATFGGVLLPIAQRVLDEFLTPGIEKAKAMAEAFKLLPTATQSWAIGLTAIAAAAPLAIVALGTLAEKGAVVLAIFLKLGGPLKAFAALFSGLGLATAAAGVGVGAFLKMLIDNGEKPVDTTAEAIKQLNARMNEGKLAAGELRLPFGLATEGIMDFAMALNPASAVLGEATGEIVEMTKRMPALLKVTADSEILTRLMTEAQQKHASAVDKGADIVRRYGTVSVETAIALATMANEQFRLNRALDEAPNLTQRFDFKDIPKFEAPPLPRSIPKDGGNRNIGPEGMMTKEQYDAMASAAKSSAKGQVAAMRQVSLVINDLARGITDVIFKGGKIGDMFQKVAMQAAQSITRLLIEGALTNLASKLVSVGGLMGKVFGGGTGVVMSAAPGIAGGAASAAGGVASAAGGAASAAGGAASAAGGLSSGIGAAAAAANPIVAMVTAVSSVVSAVSAVVANFQFAAMNKTLDIIAKHTLQTWSDVANLRADEWTREGHLMAKLDSLWRTNLDIFDLLGKGGTGGTVGGGSTFNITVTGGDTRAVMENLTRMLKLHGAIPANA